MPAAGLELISTANFRLLASFFPRLRSEGERSTVWVWRAEAPSRAYRSTRDLSRPKLDPTRIMRRPKTAPDPVPHLVDALKESFVVSPQGFES